MNRFYIQLVIFCQLAALIPGPGIVKAAAVPAAHKPPHSYKKTAEARQSDVQPPQSPLPQPAVESTPQAPEAQSSTDNSVQDNDCQSYMSGDYYLDKIIAFESSGDSCATNPGGCFGLLQACPGEPLRQACGGDPVCQIEWFQANKTGGRSWATIWQHELDYGWW